MAEDSNFSENTLTASKNLLQYNTKKDDETGNIETIFTTLSDDQKDKIEIIKGSMYYATTNTKEIEWLKQLGVEPNPYDIENGVLKSSTANLLLMDDTGTITIPGNVTKIGLGAFRNLNGLKTIIIPSNVTEIESYAFSGNATLENVILSDGLITIGDFAFQDCVSLKSINIPDSVTTLGSTCFANCTSLIDVKLSNKVKVLPYRLFSNCRSLNKITIPDAVTDIGQSCFQYCTSLETITIPKNVQTIGIEAFAALLSLKSIVIENNPNYNFSDGILFSNNNTVIEMILESITNLVVPDKVETIKSTNSYLKSITISSSVTNIVNDFPQSINNITVKEGNISFKSIDGNLYDASAEELIKYCTNESKVTLPNTVKKIRARAFSGQKDIKKIILPDSLETLSGFIFAGITLNELNIPKNVKIFTSTVFNGSNISKVTVSKENPYLKSDDGLYITSKDGKELYAVVNQTLSNYTVPESITNLDMYAFYGVAATTITLPQNLKTIEVYAFDSCANLTSIEIPATVESISTYAFSRCNSLNKITIKKSKGSISGAPWSCPYGDKAIFWEP